MENKKYFNMSLNPDDSSILDVNIMGDVGYCCSDDLDAITAVQVQKQLNDPVNANVKTINIYINSAGGLVSEGLAIYSLLKNHSATKNVYILGLACSIASIIAMAGDTITMNVSSLMLIHKALVGIIGNSDDLRTEADQLDKINLALIAAYKTKSSLKDDEILNLMTKGEFLTAQECLQYGFCTHIDDNTPVTASLNNPETLVMNGQIFNLKQFKNFNPSILNTGISKGGTNEPVNKEDGQEKDKILTNAKAEKDLVDVIIVNKKEKRNMESNAELLAEQNRVNSILNLGKNYQAADLANEFIIANKSVEEFKDELLKNQKQNEPSKLRSNELTGLTEKESKNFSFMKLIRAQSDPTNRRAQEEAKFELEACDAAAQKTGAAKNKGVIIPVEALLAPQKEYKNANIATTIGGPLIATTLITDSFIELLRNKCVMMQISRQLGGLVGNMSIPKATGKMTGSWIGEDSADGGSNPTFTDINFSPKVVSGNAYLTRQMRMQSSLDIEAYVRQDLAFALALAIDTAALYGTGSSYQPKGLINTTGINAIKFAAATPSYAEIVQMESLIAGDNADVAGMTYLVNPSMKGLMKTALKFPSSVSSAGTIWEQGNQINGYNAYSTNQVNTNDVFFGNFADFIVAMWGGLELLVDPFTNSTRGGTVVSAFQDIDLGVRHEGSFCFGSSVIGAGVAGGSADTVTGGRVEDSITGGI